MPHGWPFNALSAASRSRCGRGGARHLLAQATDAFVDRAPIDWPSLLTRAATRGERACIENLHLLDVIRRAAAPTARPPETAPRSALLHMIVALATLHTLGSLLTIAAAVADGGAATLLPTQIVLASAFASAGIVLGATASRDARRLYLLGTYACAASSFAGAALTGIPEPWPGDALLRGLRLEVFIPACLWQFALDFPRVQRFTRFEVLARRTTATVWLLGLSAFGLNLAVAAGMLDESALVQLLPAHRSNIFWRVFTLASVLAVGAIFIRSRHAPLPERSRVARFALGLSVGAAPFLLLGVARTVMPRLDRWLLTASTVERFWLDVVIAGGLTAVPILTTAAVLADRPFELQAMVRRAWRRGLATTGRTMLILLPFVLLAVFVYPRRHQTIGELLAGPAGSVALAMAVVASVMLVARARRRDPVGARVRWRQRNHDRLTQGIARLQAARGGREAGRAIEEALASAIGATAVRLLTEEEATSYTDPWRTLHLPPDTRLLALVRAAEEPLDLSSESDVTALLPYEERQWLTANRVELAAPIRRRDGSLAAMLVCGPRRGHRPFERREVSIVHALAAAASAAWTSVPSECAFECPQCGCVDETATARCACGLRPVLASLPRHLDSKYLVLQRVGAGSTGVVYRAHDTASGAQVALKTLPELGPSTVARLRAESRVLAGLRHDGIAAFHELVIWRDTPVIVMDYFAAGTLARKIRNQSLSPAAVRDLGVQLTGALAYIHERGLLHRDVKPTNVALTPAGEPRLLDFGLAELFDRGPATYPGHCLAGTLAYLPPEAFSEAAPSPAFDLWALAVTLFEALTGANPFVSHSRRVTLRRIVRVDPTALCLPFGVERCAFSSFFHRALARPPKERFQTAREMGEALDPLDLR
jgi:Protein kinase domain